MIVLYHHPASASSAKVRLILAEKGLTWKSEIVELFKGWQFDEKYIALNPSGLVPTLVSDGRPIPESLVICEYLEEAYPTPSLVPADFGARARMRVWCKDIETFMTTALTGVVFSATDRFEIAKLSSSEIEAYYAGHPNRRLAERKRVWLDKGYADPDARNAVLTYNKFLQKMEIQLSKGSWLAGEFYSLADIEATPYVAVLDLLNFDGWWRGKMPHLVKWYEKVKSRPSFQPAIIDVLPKQLQDDMAKRGAEAWPAVDAILATAEPYNGRSPWAMRAESL